MIVDVYLFLLSMFPKFSSIHLVVNVTPPLPIAVISCKFCFFRKPRKILNAVTPFFQMNALSSRYCFFLYNHGFTNVIYYWRMRKLFCAISIEEFELLHYLPLNEEETRIPMSHNLRRLLTSCSCSMMTR